MRHVGIMVLLFFLYILPSTPKHIAVIGAGAGGTSAAYFARELLNPDKITIFEQNNRIGGRALSTTFVGKHCELGAGSIHSLNHFLVDFGKKFGVSKKDVKDKLTRVVGVWDGNQLLWKEQSNWLYNTGSVVWRYGLSPFWASRFAKSYGEKWDCLYKDTTPWHSLEEFLQRHDLFNEANVTFEDTLINQLGCSPAYVNEIMSGLTRVIYNQNVSTLSTAAGYISIFAASGEIFSFEDNKKVFEKLVENSDVDLRLNTRVLDISLKFELTTEELDDDINRFPHEEVPVLHSSSATTYTVTYTREEGGQESQDFDAVFLATPLELTDISLSPPVSNLKPRDYLKVHVTLVHGNLNFSYFGLQEGERQPTQFFTTQNFLPWTGLDVKYKFDDGSVIVKFFSIEEIDDKELSKIFSKIKETQKSSLYAYPILHPTTTFPPIKLGPHFYYINAFESYLSVMEGSVVSAWNAVRLLDESWADPE